MYYFSPLFIKDSDKVLTRNLGSVAAFEKNIDIINKKKNQGKV